jgi:glycerate kinase
MRVLLAFDKFKGSLSAPQACDLALRALRGRHRDWQLDSCPLTDGGEGFTEILTAAAKGRRTRVDATGPRGGLVAASIGLIAQQQIPSPVRQWFDLPGTASESRRPLAVIEMAAASGLNLLPPEQHDPWQATTYGTGQLIRAAAELSAAGILLGVGGSATNDLGLGALAALGLEFRDADGGKIRPPAPVHWHRIAAIEGEVFPSIPPICIASDVTNLWSAKGPAPRGPSANGSCNGAHGPPAGRTLPEVPRPRRHAGGRSSRRPSVRADRGRPGAARAWF